MSLPSSPSSAGAPSEPDAPSLPYLVGFDGSVRSLAAARWAAREAGPAGAALRLLHVGHAWPTIQPISPEFQPVLGESARAAEGVLSALAEELRALHPGLTVETATAEGGPASELPRAAAHARLLVVGAGGHNHHVPLLGSTALHVAGRSEIPVVLIREPAAAPAAAAERGQRGRGVVVGVDPAGDYEAVLGFGYAWAEAHGLPLRAVHAGPEPAQSLEAAVAKVSAAYPGVATECVSRPGDPAHVLVDESATADLLVVGRRHHRPLHGLGPTDHAVAHYARGPVALIPHG
ncbi:universal stress protein [Streptomyces sp. NBC_00503]|uniref:universal stress protein n=1 Tax=Streptomyces sp. NBC_00503 TaxID=2903659 RepID=UPI002E81BA8C|nr:universal stress protein [Streptomyces sp. NBC_00503]WUD82268.1 universal stress protein [Streptomyces sp. NBC_00503]